MQQVKTFKNSIDTSVSRRRAEMMASIFNTLCIVASVSTFFIESGKANLYLTTLLPLAGMFLMMFSNGRITLIADDNQKLLPNLILGLAIITAVSYFYLSKKFHILNYDGFWIPFASIAITTILFLITVGMNRSGRAAFQYVLIATLSCFYAAGTTIQINCVFDSSAPIKFNTSVQSKHTSKDNKLTIYHLILTPWERGQTDIDITVSGTEYAQTPVDGPVGGHIKRGLLGIKWFYLDM